MARNWDAINKYVADDEEIVPAAVPEVAEDVAVPQVDLAAAASREPAGDQAESQKIMEAVLPLAFSFFGGEAGAISTPKTMTQVQSMQEKVAAREQKNKLANQALLSKQAQMLQAAKDKAEARAISEDHFNRTDQRIIEQGDLNRKASMGARYDAAQAREDAASEKRNDKKEKDDLERAVPGYEATGEVRVKPEEAMKFRKASANAEQLVSKLDRLGKLVKENGSYEFGGNAGTEMSQLATEIQLIAKGEDMYQLGVLTGPDLSLLQKITADPSSLDSMFTRDSSRETQIATQLKSIKDKLSSTAKSMGYRKAGAEKTIVKEQRNAKTGQTRVVYSDGTTEIKD